jgi:hypothetical protein
MKLKEIAYGRSGDKGSNANIGLIAYHEKDYETLKRIVTPERITKHFHTLSIHKVHIYELPNLWALNVILVGALEGGGSVSLKSDSQGKGLAQLLLEMEY